MAANSNSRGIASVGKRLVNQIWLANNTSRRAAYSSLYEKNLDDPVRPSAVPDDVIQAAQSDKYWAPHPQTGVFGPAAEQGGSPSATDGADRSFHSATADAGADSVLEEKAWFRPVSLEDTEKPNN
ncbi:late embryogenesis abundant protein At5g17165-like [Prosopis cineraria]|uniref:late embryogenesis abundant protein At5g17165-like n=1 Tax=Prosopis cineraria TaxID=364024 RepID=UPI00240ED41B|nr:late embryogenesis abundant protein At5g17165-like [Prosopis cineraria]